MKKFNVTVKVHTSRSELVRDHWWSFPRENTIETENEKNIIIEESDAEHAMAVVKNMISMIEFFRIAKFSIYFDSKSSYEVIRAEEIKD